MRDLTQFLSAHGVERGETITYEKTIELLESFTKEMTSKEKSSNYKKWTSEEFRCILREYKSVYQDAMLWNFYLYWSEPTASGKMKLQLEKTWETGRRLARWNNNNQNSSVVNNGEQKSRYKRPINS